MIRSGKFISLLFLSVVVGSGAFSQNLFDSDHSKQFADYLLTSRQYQLAAMELERVIIMEPDNMVARKNLVFSYRQDQQYPLALKRLHEWYPDFNPDSLLAEEWIKVLLLSRQPKQTEQYLQNSRAYTEEEKQYYAMANFLLSGDWDAATKIAQTASDGTLPASFTQLIRKKNNLRYKSPALATTLSAIIPGLGKVYTTDWKDGLVSFLFVATNAWQSYRGFSKDGINSVNGWIFGTMAIGFYSSNIYGSWKSAQNYNEKLNHDLFHEIENAVYNRF